MTPRFEAYCRRKEAIAAAAVIPGYSTAEERPGPNMVTIGSAWSRALFDGDFYRSAPPGDDLPSINLVFVRSRDGNTVAPDPAVFGGGTTDLHVVYEGLARVDADAVLAGSATARARELVFSVWHPELVALRLARGRTRHPAQVIVTERGELRFDEGLMFQEPELRVFIVTGSRVAERLRLRLADRPFIEIIDAGEPVSLARAMRDLRARGIEVISCVGGPKTATAFLQEQLISDIYLTTSAIEAGEPGTPYHYGPAVPQERTVLKLGKGPEEGVRFEHFVVRREG